MSPICLIIPILLPLAGGGVLLLRTVKDRGRVLWTEGVACLTSVVVFALLFSVPRGQSVTVYSFFGGFSVGFMVDGPSSLFAGMVAVMWPLALLYGYSYMEEERRLKWRNNFFAFYLMTYGITLGVAFSENLVTMYVFFEMLTLITIPLVMHWQNAESIYAGRVYTAYCIAGASMAFIAVVMGTLDGSGSFLYGGNLANEYNPSLMRLIYLFGFFGFGTKAAVFPFFRWLPQASVAPTPVTALLHAVAVVNSGAYAVMRLTWYAYGPDLLSGSRVQAVCLLTAAFSMVFAAVMALRQGHFKRRLAYSTMSNLSYILFGVSLMTPDGYWGGLAHMLFHGVIKMSLFLCAGAFIHVTGRAYVYEINGAGRRMPFTFAAYTLGALSLTGIPLFCGFISKWRLLTAGVGQGSPAALAGTAALIASAFLCALYSLSVSVRAYFPPAGTARYEPGVREADWRMLLPIGVFTGANLLFGLWSGPVMDWIGAIARGM